MSKLLKEIDMSVWMVKIFTSDGCTYSAETVESIWLSDDEAQYRLLELQEAYPETNYLSFGVEQAAVGQPLVDMKDFA